MKKASEKKLKLSRETVATLESGALVNVAGGSYTCYCPSMHSCPVTK